MSTLVDVNAKSAQFCGCDEGAKHRCERHSHGSVPGTELFVTKDSGERRVFESGMQRDITAGKLDYSLVLDGPMFERWAGLMTRGAVKYEARNWMKAASQEELDRFKQSAFRHFIQWFSGDTTEDHAAAVIFNINGAEYTKGKL